MLDPFQLEFVQRGVLEVLLLSAAAGLLGTWIVMRGLSFYAHAVGTAAFPGLVLADGLGFSAPLGAFAAALVFAFGVERLARRPRAGYDSLTALVLVAALAGGVVLASDVFHSGGNVDSLLFGSLLLTGTRDLVLAGAASAAAVAATLALGPRWLARGFDPAAARAMGLRSQWPDALLLVLVAFAVVASLTRDRRAARDRAVRRPGRDGAAVDGAPGRSGSSARSRSPPCRASRDSGSPSSSTRRPVRPSRCSAAALFALSLARAPIAAALRGRAALAGAALLAALVLTACGGGSGSHGRGPDVVAIDDADRRLGARRGGRCRQRPPDPPRQHRSARVRAATGRRRGGRGREARVRER